MPTFKGATDANCCQTAAPLFWWNFEGNCFVFLDALPRSAFRKMLKHDSQPAAVQVSARKDAKKEWKSH
jgi:hypothetical protein